MSTSIAIENGLDWDVFVDRYWDRQPVLIRQPDPAPFLAEKAFAAARAASDTENPGVLLTMDGITRTLTEQILPRSQDADFTAYATRMRAYSPTVTYSLLIAGFHSYDRALWQREQDFLRPLWERVGLPLTGAITTLFHGPYAATPVGVHRDRFATFMFLVEGRKQMRFWPRRPWEDDISSMQDYAHLLDSSFVVEPEIGDLLYWPAEYYHVGEGADTNSATSVNIGIPRTEHQVRFDLERLVVDLTTDTLMNTGPTARMGMPPIDEPMSVPMPGPDGRVETVPPALRSAYRQLASSVLDDRVEEASALQWRAGGLQPIPRDRVDQSSR